MFLNVGFANPTFKNIPGGSSNNQSMVTHGEEPPGWINTKELKSS